jgi:hypothetical protein
VALPKHHATAARPKVLLVRNTNNSGNSDYKLEVLKPHIVFLLGKQVADFVLRKNGIAAYQ